MFTGIVEEVGTIGAVERTADAARIRVTCTDVVTDAVHGASIAVNGICLTVTGFDGAGFWADVMKVSLDYTALGETGEGSRVNLERATPAGGRLGGHIVQGHVDGTATVTSRTPGSDWEILRFTLDDPALARYVAKKGSVAVNGTSLTVSEVGPPQDAWFEVSLIPTTLSETMLGDLEPGAHVNIECDVLAKYVERLTAADSTTINQEEAR
ncbi:MAG: riboflavin synthase [Mycobacteriaceae bacterium]|uniref:riboflavin synthase n=1 Tax=Corynebacterium sp. TaxID=1720 RepID=UPI003F9E83DD